MLFINITQIIIEQLPNYNFFMGKTALINLFKIYECLKLSMALSPMMKNTHFQKIQNNDNFLNNNMVSSIILKENLTFILKIF